MTLKLERWDNGERHREVSQGCGAQDCGRVVLSLPGGPQAVQRRGGAGGFTGESPARGCGPHLLPHAEATHPELPSPRGSKTSV